MDVRGIKSFVLRSGRMSDAQKRSYDNLSPSFCVSRENDITDYADIFGNSNPVIIEIGFGSGTATAIIAEENPKINYLGIEVFRPGIGRLLWEIEKRKLENIRIIEGDAAEILCNLPPASASGLHIFFPDPWPKKRHHKRRLVTRPFTSALGDCLLAGGYVYMVTDWADYADWALAELSATPGLVNQYEGFAHPQSWRPKTRFEDKGLNKNHEIRELYFIKA
jgi:tRNA (guanine-N7-)-methyltransferase